MLKGLNIKELAEKIFENQQHKKDFISNTATETEMILEGNNPLLKIKGQGTFPIQPLAHDQIGGKAGIPAKYYDKMLTEAPELLANNVNTWFRRFPERRMTRTLNGNVRAFLSDRYQRIENEEIASAALPVLRELPGVNIVSSEVTDKRLYIHFVVPTIFGEVKKGDIVQAGGIISNSEVGCGSCSVSGLVWRLACLNGMKTQEAFRRNHVGRKIEDNDMLWADDTRAADDKAILLKVRDMVRAVVDETRFRQNINTMAGLSRIVISGNPELAVEVLAQKVGVSEEERGGILRELIKGGDLSAWGMLNAVTAQSHTAKNYDRAVEFEAAGGMLLDLPRTEWSRILEAA